TPCRFRRGRAMVPLTVGKPLLTVTERGNRGLAPDGHQKQSLDLGDDAVGVGATPDEFSAFCASWIRGPMPSATADSRHTQRMSRSRDLLTATFSAWLVAGVCLDAWAHNTRPSLETFFTPWHAVLYSGFLATAGWVTWIVWPALRGAGSWATALPPGY